MRAGGAQLLVASILTVSARYVDAWLAALMEELPRYLADEDEVILLHFGVDDKCTVDLKLEVCCKPAVLGHSLGRSCTHLMRCAKLRGAGVRIQRGRLPRP